MSIPSIDNHGALGGLRVLDLSRILAGPWAAQTLADLGAEVIKVERPKLGDDTRRWGPPYLKNSDGQDSDEAAYYHCANRGKRSVCIDIASELGQQAIKDLVGQSDILIENYKAGGLAAYGLDYESLHAINPRLIYCSITGFGQTGPLSKRPGYDFLIQAMGGLMSITGETDDKPGGGPQRAGVALSDIMTGLYASISILAAVNERHQSGLGQHIDLSLLDVTVASLANQASNYLIGGDVPQRMGNSHPNIVPYQSFATSDGYIILAIGNDAQFQRFCEAAGCASLAQNNDYSSNPARVANRETLVGILTPILQARSSDDWIDTLEQVQVPAGPINNIDQVFNNPQVQSRNMQIELDHNVAGSVRLVASPIKLSRTPVRYTRAAPTLNQDENYVLKELCGYSDQQIQALQD